MRPKGTHIPVNEEKSEKKRNNDLIRRRAPWKQSHAAEDEVNPF